MYFILLNNKSLTAKLVVDFIILRLLQKFRLKEVVYKVINYFRNLFRRKRDYRLAGYKIMVNGRFNRRVRVTYF